MGISSVLILSLLVWSKWKNNGSYNSTFNRTFSNLQLKRVSSYPVDKGINKLDIFNNDIYLNDSNLRRIFIIKPKDTIFLDYGPLLNDADFESYNSDGDSLFFSVPSEKSFYYVNLKGKETINKKINSYAFSRGIKYKNGFIVKECYNKDCNHEVFTNISEDRNSYDVITRRNDGGILQDGFFLEGKNGVLFISYLQPEIFFFNEKGEFKKKISTIDNRIDKIDFTKVKDGAYTFKNIPFTHQLSASSYDDKLYLLSAVMDEESIKLKHTNIIDVYSIKDGKYLHSFTLPDNKDVYDFKIKGNEVIVLYKDLLGNKKLTTFLMSNYEK